MRAIGVAVVPYLLAIVFLPFHDEFRTINRKLLSILATLPESVGRLGKLCVLAVCWVAVGSWLWLMHLLKQTHDLLPASTQNSMSGTGKE